MPHRLVGWAPKKVVRITFGRDPETGEIDHLAPFVATDTSGLHSGIYDDEPHVTAEIEANTRIAYFEAQWVHGRWMFGHRVQDQEW